MRRSISRLVCTLSVCLAACGGDDGGGASNANTGKSDAGSGKADGGSTVGEGCGLDMMSGTDMGGCTEAQISVYSDCLESACKSQYTDCYGPDYKKGKYAGACGEFLTCSTKCDCDDETCQAACQPSDACTKCQSGFVSCATSCLSKLSCATGDLGDAGIRFDKTCADLLSCCNKQTDSDQKTACTTVHDQFASTSNADVYCSAAISSFCP